jgi:chromosome segregation ATPase
MDNQDLQVDLKGKQEEINGLRNHKERTNKMLEAMKKKKSQDDQETSALENSKNTLKGEIADLGKSVEWMKKKAEEQSKQIVDLLHERDILNKNVIKADDRSKKQFDLVKRHEGQGKALEKDVQRWKLELQNKLHRVHELDKQREKYSIELNLAHGKFVNASEELKNKDNQLANLKKMITDVKSKLNQQKNLYEAVRTDKNLYSKNLIESLEEISEMRKKFKIMYHQIEQLKEEIKEKDSQLIKEHFEHHRVSKDSEKIKDNLDKATKKQKHLQQVVDQQRTEIKKLEATIQEAEVERQNQKKEFEGVTSERDILGTQLIRRNDELALLYEKIKIQQSTLQKGEIQYKERLDEIRNLKGKIAQLKLDLHIAKQQAVNIDDLKKEVYHLQRELLQERTKVKALSEELENPMNVHRWRKLEGSDPATYELIQKVKTLQKRLIQKTEEVVEKDLQIQEKEKLYVELKSILARQPGPEVREQLEMYEENLQAKKKQMRAMQSELRTYQAQVGDYRDEIDRLTRELQEVKRKYFEQKKKEQVSRDTQRGDTKVIHTNPPQQPRFTGGGFNLSM